MRSSCASSGYLEFVHVIMMVGCGTSSCSSSGEISVGSPGDDVSAVVTACVTLGWEWAWLRAFWGILSRIALLIFRTRVDAIALIRAIPMCRWF